MLGYICFILNLQNEAKSLFQKHCLGFKVLLRLHFCTEMLLSGFHTFTISICTVQDFFDKCN